MSSGPRDEIRELERLVNAVSNVSLHDLTGAFHLGVSNELLLAAEGVVVAHHGQPNPRRCVDPQAGE